MKQLFLHITLLISIAPSMVACQPQNTVAHEIFSHDTEFTQLAADFDKSTIMLPAIDIKQIEDYLQWLLQQDSRQETYQQEAVHIVAILKEKLNGQFDPVSKRLLSKRLAEFEAEWTLKVEKDLANPKVELSQSVYTTIALATHSLQDKDAKKLLEKKKAEKKAAQREQNSQLADLTSKRDALDRQKIELSTAKAILLEEKARAEKAAQDAKDALAKFEQDESAMNGQREIELSDIEIQAAQLKLQAAKNEANLTALNNSLAKQKSTDWTCIIS